MMYTTLDFIFALLGGAIVLFQIVLFYLMTEPKPGKKEERH